MPRRRLRKVIYILLFLAGGLLVARAFVLPWVIENELTWQIENRFKGRVTLEDLDLDLLAGRIQVRGLRYRTPEDKTVFLLKSGVARFSPSELLDGTMRLRRLDLEGGELFLRVTPEGSNLEDNFKATPKTATKGKDPDLTHLVLHDCILQLNAPQVFRKDMKIKINGEILPSGLDARVGRVDLELQGIQVAPGEGTGLDAIHLQGKYHAGTTAFKLSTDSKGVQLTPAMRELLNPRLVKKGWDWLNPVGSVRVEVEGDLHRVDGRPNYQISLYNAGGLGIRIHDFPYAAANLQGVTLIRPGEAGRRGSLDLVDLQGTHGRAIATISGKVYGYLEEPGEPWVHLAMEARDIPLDEDLKHALDKVDPEFGRIWDAISPAGTADFQCLLFKSDQGGRVRAAITANIRSGTFNYLGFVSKGSGTRKGFPYPLSDVTGSFETHLGYSRFDFTGRGSGRSDIHVSGEVRSHFDGRPTPVLDILIQGKDVPLDDTFRRAMLDLGWQRTWKRLQPEGHVDISVHLTQAGADVPLQVDVTLNLKGRAAFTHEMVPTKLTAVWGKVRFKSGWEFPLFEDVSGQVNSGNFRLSGTLKPLAKDPFLISLSGPFLSRQLTHALRRSPSKKLQLVGKYLTEYAPVGNAEAIIELRGLGELHPKVEFKFKGAKADGPALPFELESLFGSIQYDGRYLRFETLNGWHNGGWIEIHGEERLGDEDGYLDLTVECQNLTLSSARSPVSSTREGEGSEASTSSPLSLVEPFLSRLRPGGLVKRLNFEYDSRDKVRYPSLVMTVRNLEVSPTHSLIGESSLQDSGPPPIRIEKGTVYYNPGEGLRLENLEAVVGQTRFSSLNARYRTRGSDRIVKVSTRADRMDLDCPVFTYLGGDIPGFLKPFKASGTLDADPINFEVRIPVDGPASVLFTGTTILKFNELHCKVGPEIRNLSGKIEVNQGSRISGGEAGTTLQGRFKDLDLNLFGCQLENLNGNLSVKTVKKSEGKGLFLKLDDLSADFYEGRLGPGCMLDVSLSSQHAFEGFLLVNNVQVERLVRDLTGSESREGGITGLLTGQFRFEAAHADLSSLVGMGRGEVKKGKFGSIPAFVTLFNYFNNHFHEVKANHFEVKNKTIYLGSFGHLELDNPLLEHRTRDKDSSYFQVVSDALTLEGSGRMNFGGEMEFRFKPKDIWISTPIPGLKDIFDILYQQAGTIYVLGTIERIDVQPILFGIGRPRTGEKQPLRIPDRALWPAQRW